MIGQVRRLGHTLSELQKNRRVVPSSAGAGSVNSRVQVTRFLLDRVCELAQRSALWVSTRQFVHERSGLPPPSLHPPPSHSNTLYQMATQLSQRAISFIPSAFRPTHLHFSPPPPLSASCYHDPITFSLRTAEREGSPTFMVTPLFCILLTLKGPVLAPTPCTHPPYESCSPSKKSIPTSLTPP